MSRRIHTFVPSLTIMTQGASPPVPEGYDEGTYQYESDGEELLGETARTLLHQTGGNYRCELFLKSHAQRLTGFQGHERHCLHTTGKQALIPPISMLLG